MGIETWFIFVSRDFYYYVPKRLNSCLTCIKYFIIFFFFLIWNEHEMSYMNKFEISFHRSKVTFSSQIFKKNYFLSFLWMMFCSVLQISLNMMAEFNFFLLWLLNFTAIIQNSFFWKWKIVVINLMNSVSLEMYFEK